MPAYGKKRVKVAEWWEVSNGRYFLVRADTKPGAEYERSWRSKERVEPLKLIHVTRYRLVKR